MNVYVCSNHTGSQAFVGAGSIEEIKASGCVVCLLEQYGDHTYRCDARHSEGPCTCGWTHAKKRLFDNAG